MHVCGALPERRAHCPRRRVATRRPGRWSGLLIALSLAGPVAAVKADEDEAPRFELPGASVRLAEEVYRLDAVARLRLSADAREALDNGVDLTLAWEASIERTREWWLDAEVAHIVQRYRLSLHELTQQYVVTNVNTGQQRSYTRLQTALDQIGALVGFPLVDRVLVQDSVGLVGHVRIGLQHDELPLPLRAVALFDDDWDHQSEWFEWRFE